MKKLHRLCTVDELDLAPGVFLSFIKLSGRNPVGDAACVRPAAGTYAADKMCTFYAQPGAFIVHCDSKASNLQSRKRAEGGGRQAETDLKGRRMFEHSEHALAASEAVDRVLDRFGLPPKTRRRLAGEVALEMERRYVAFAEALTIMVLLPEIQARAATVFRRDYDLADVEAEELGANVADKIHRALFAAWPRASLTAWVRRIVKNTFIDHQRKTKRKWARANRERPVANLDIYPATATQWDELAEILVDAPRELREIVRQRLWGEDWAEIAAAAGLTVEDAKASVHRLLFGGSSSPRRRSRRTSSH